MNLIKMHLPNINKIHDWHLLFSTDRDTRSMETFYKNVRGSDNTIILIQDHNDQILGGYISDQWLVSDTFYGTGTSSFLFRFKKLNTEILIQRDGNDYKV